MLGSKPPPRTRLGFRFAVFALIVVMVVGLLTTRLFYLQVIQGGYYAGLSEENQHATIPLPGGQGLDLRPRRQAAGDQHPVVRRQDPPRGPAVHRA